ncbi:MAG: mechanosensitive ion channel [Gammaproteobacteria bacterium]|nr:mechanosensitive ion channel [Gammaproteobacteria bacterium]
MEFNAAELTAMAIPYGIKLVSAIVTLVVGLMIANMLVSLTKKIMTKSKVDPSLISFLGSMVGMVLKVLVYITALSVLGVEMTSFVAILGAAGLAVGLALSGTLQNFAGGVMILLFKPYKIGDFIEAQGYTGSVKEIQIFITVLTTSDNKTILIPNGPLATSSIINYSTQPTRRVDWEFGIAYGDDVDKAYEVLNKLIAADERILKDPEHSMALKSLGDSAVIIVVKAWVKAPDYWGVLYKMNEEVYKTFGDAGLSFPFPQMDVHLSKES